jgi:glycosyltransferase involved in cell wall biosynthesis
LNNRSLLFYGELPPNAIHGISYANLINLNQLRGLFDIRIVEENSRLQEHKLITFKKAIRVLRDQLSIISESLKRHYDYFYLTFSVSRFGCIKTVCAIINFKIFNSGEVVLHIHRGDFFSWYSNKSFNKFLAQIAIRFSNKIIVLSETQKTEFNRIFDKPTFVLHNTVEAEFKYVLAEKRNRHFLFISNYLTEKGIFDLLDVFSTLVKIYPDIFIFTYGSFPSKDIKERVLRYRTSNIIINESIVGSEKFAEIAKADCLILPSWNEGEPMVILEAMSVGTPIICSNVGLIQEILGDDYPFYTLPGNRDSLEEKIIRFINYENLYPLSEKIKEIYQSKYSNKAHFSDLKNIFT